MRYEILMLAVPEITLDEAAQLETQFRDVIRDNQGSCISFERWGKYRLAYPVKGNEYGVYFLIRFECLAQAAVPSLLRAIRDLLTLKYNEIVMRHLVNKLSLKASLAYQRPESLEEIPGKVTDSLMREHKLETHGDARSSRDTQSFTEEL